VWDHKRTIPSFKLSEPSLAEGAGILSSVGDTAAELFLSKGIPFLAKKGAEAGRYYASEALRNPALQKKAINYGLKKARPAIDKVGRELLDQLSTKIRPNKRYKTNRPDLDGAGFDLHSAIGKLPAPKKGWTLPGHNYTGPYNPLEQQLKYNPETGEILEIYQQPTGSTDAVAMQHDVDYSSCAFRKQKYDENEQKCKNQADRKMVKSLDSIPRKKRQWGHALARNVINSKQKLGLGVK
jgi:hypothetical protein